MKSTKYSTSRIQGQARFDILDKYLDKYSKKYTNRGKTLKIGDFIKGRNVSYQTVHKYIKRHWTDFENHCPKGGKTIELDDEAVEMLGAVYPYPKPVEVVQDNGLMSELAAAYKQLSEARERISELSLELADARAAQYLLKDKQRELAERENQIQGLKLELDSYQKTLFGLYRKTKRGDGEG